MEKLYTKYKVLRFPLTDSKPFVVLNMILPRVKSVGEQIICRLRGELLRGSFAGGTPLREEDIAERFGVSRVPVRHVFQELVHEGLLVSRRNKGVTVAQPISELAREALTPVRKTLELYALRQWFDSRTAACVSKWIPLLSEMRTACESRDHDTIIDLDIAFHSQLFHQANLEALLPVWRPAMTQLRAYHLRQNQRSDLGNLLVIHAIHEKLLDLFKQHDFLKAEAALASHLTDGKFNQKIRQSFLDKGQSSQPWEGQQR